MRGTVYRYLRYGGCAALGIVFFLGAEAADTDRQTVDKGILKRNPWGQRDAVYEFYAEGLEEGAVELAVTVPPRRLSPKEFHQRMPEISEILLSGILGSNVSLDQIRTDLELPEELPQSGDVEQQAIRSALSEQAQAVLHGLEEPYKEVFMLRVYGELSFRRIGALFQKSENWACVVFHRARNKIKLRMEEKS